MDKYPIIDFTRNTTNFFFTFRVIIWNSSGQLTQHYPSDFVAPLRICLFAYLTTPQNPNLTLHNIMSPQ